MAVDTELQRRYEYQKYARIGAEHVKLFSSNFNPFPSTFYAWDFLHLRSKPMTLLFAVLNLTLILLVNSGSFENAWNWDKGVWIPEFFISMFLNANYFQFGCSLVLLWIAGIRLEEFLGSGRYTLLYLAGYCLSFIGILPFLEGNTPLIAAGGPVGVLAGASIILFEKLGIADLSLELILSAKVWISVLLSIQTVVLLFSDVPWNAWLVADLGFFIGLGMGHLFKRIFKLHDCSLM
ncbi:rhomboid family intramembrane serine protease [Oligoflexus tunisiensis]|uniref:rhomboid family intramembrane serine protease n=1 Tax=Oligoflexus tunisiensis TaxID=708132 RepID=UPI001FE04006|nr:rhomboid family intramembrane serine protease [Oligoflexus tunisiensis]